MYMKKTKFPEKNVEQLTEHYNIMAQHNQIHNNKKYGNNEKGGYWVTNISSWTHTTLHIAKKINKINQRIDYFLDTLSTE